MPGKIREAAFRLEHGFAVKPDLTLDKIAGNDLIIGQNAPGEPPEAIYLGKQAETPYRNVWMDTRGAHVIYAMGKRRSGKSFTLGVLAEGLISESWIRQGSASQGVLILDTMNVYLTMPFAMESIHGDATAPIKELRKWNLEAEELPITLFRTRGSTTPPAVASTEITLRPADLGPDEWCGLFEVDPFADPLG